MIRAIEFENYKAFGERTRLKFAPITLIYGQNSAGKSSILNAMNLLKQTRMSRDQNALLSPRMEGGIVDLGSFRDLLHDHDTSKTLCLRLEVDDPRAKPGRVSAVELGFRRDDERRDVSLSFLSTHTRSQAGEEISFRFEPRDATDEEKKRRRPFFRPWQSRVHRNRELVLAQCVSVHHTQGYWQRQFKAARSASSTIVDGLRQMHDEFRDSAPESRFHLDVPGYKSTLDFYRKDFTYEDFVARRREASMAMTVELDGFLPRPLRWQSGFLEDSALSMSERRHRLFDETDIVLAAALHMEHALEMLFPLGPYRRAPERLYVFTGTTPLDVGYSGALLPDLLFRKTNLLDSTNDWLDRLDIGYHVEIEGAGARSKDLFEVRLRDTRRPDKPSIALPDVGFGISQILPLIVQTLASERRTISVEQPEVHVHPKLQADLADLFIEGIQKDKRHSFIIETHSEHLLLRPLRRIRETTNGELPKGHPGLTPNQVSIIYMARGADGAEVHHLGVDSGGEFTQPWPGGFFEERARELF